MLVYYLPVHNYSIIITVMTIDPKLCDRKMKHNLLHLATIYDGRDEDFKELVWEIKACLNSRCVANN